MGVQPAERGRNPFDTTGVTRGGDGIARYDDLPSSLVAMLRANVDRDRRRHGGRRGRRRPGDLRRAVGPRRPGGRRPAHRGRAARRPRRDPAAQRAGLGPGLLGHTAGRGGRGAGQHALQGLRGRLRHRGLRRALRVPARRAAARRRAGGRRGQRAGRPRGDLLHQRDHRLSQGRDDLARELPGQRRERDPLRRDRSRGGPVARHAGQRAAVPRHGLQQPADRPQRARRPDVRADQPAGSRRLLAHGQRGGGADAHVGAGDLPRADPPPALRARPTCRASAGSPTAGRRSPRRRSTRSWPRSPVRGSATGSA